MSKYFNNVKDLETLRKTWKELLKANHPDNGGSVEACQAINAEYKEMFEMLKNKHFTRTESTTESTSWSYEADEELRKVLYNIIHLDGLNIEIVGSWIWVDGNTYPYRETLKENGFKWSNNRKKWHFSVDDGGYRKGRKCSFEDLKEKHGFSTVKTSRQAQLA